MIRNRVHRAHTDPTFAQVAAPTEAAIVAAAYGVDAAVIYDLARDWLVEGADMAGATVLDDVETAHHVEYEHTRGWRGLLANPELLEASQIPAESRDAVLVAARQWIWDASGAGLDDGDQFQALTTEQVLRKVRQTYQGGWVQFLADGNPDKQPHQTSTDTPTTRSLEGDPR